MKLRLRFEFFFGEVGIDEAVFRFWIETRICKYQIAASLRNSRPSKTPLHHLIMLSFIMIRIFSFYRVCCCLCILNLPAYPPWGQLSSRWEGNFWAMNLSYKSQYLLNPSNFEEGKAGWVSRSNTILLPELFVVFSLFLVNLVDYCDSVGLGRV